MRLLLLLLVLFTVGAASAWYLRDENGYVLLSYGQWMVETSVVGFAAALIVAVLLLMLLFRAVAASVRLPGTVRNAMAQRRARKQHHALVQGVKHWLAGREERAEVLLQKAVPDSDEAAAWFLLCALAAQRHPERARHYLERAAVLDDPLAEEAIALMRGDAAVRDADAGALAQARDALQALRRRAPSHPRIYPALAEVMVAAGDWSGALDLLRDAEKARGWAPGRWRELMTRALRGALDDAQRIEDAKSVWARVPRQLQTDAACTLDYARSLHRLNAENECLALIHRTLDRQWVPELVQLFLRMEPADRVAALSSVEQWLQRHGDKPELLLVAAHTCRRNRLWGKARSYLDALLAQSPGPQACYEYGRLCAETDRPDEARAHFQKGLELALHAPEAPPPVEEQASEPERRAVA